MIGVPEFNVDDSASTFTTSPVNRGPGSWVITATGLTLLELPVELVTGSVGTTGVTGATGVTGGVLGSVGVVVVPVLVLLPVVVVPEELLVVVVVVPVELDDDPEEPVDVLPLVDPEVVPVLVLLVPVVVPLVPVVVLLPEDRLPVVLPLVYRYVLRNPPVTVS